jgi:hypothetical protein
MGTDTKKPAGWRKAQRLEETAQAPARQAAIAALYAKLAEEGATAEALAEMHRWLLANLLWMIRNTSRDRLRAWHLDTCRAFLRDNGYVGDMAMTADVARSLEYLKGLELPFNTDPPPTAA